MAMNNDLLAMVTYIERERGVDREIVLVAIEQAIQQAARHNPGVTNDLRVAIDRKTLQLHVYDTLVVSDEDSGTGFISVARAKRFKPDAAEGDTIEVEMPASRLGRIAAQTSRQMIMQKIRDAERSNVFSAFKGRIGEIVTGTVSAVNRRDLYVLVGKTEMLLPGKERIPTEEYNVGDSIKAIVDEVKQDVTGPAVKLSRASAEFVRTLFRLEVSEIAEGVVETRVRNIVRELNGEKIDIVRWSDDIKQYVAQALAPAKLETIEVDPEGRNTVHVTVAPDQYSLAIGKRGQNVRLTSKLTGWNVEITKAMALASFEDQKAEAIKTLADTFSVSTAVATQLADAGFLTVEGIIESDEEGFIAATGFDEVTAKGLYAAAQAVAEATGLAQAAEDEPAAEETEEA